MSKKVERCDARVEFQSGKALILSGGEVISGVQGVLTCKYPEKSCMLKMRRNSGCPAHVLGGNCKFMGDKN